jgi:major intracellular serine protease
MEKPIRTPLIIKHPRLPFEMFSQTVGYQISKHNIPDLWLETQGENITVAVLDTGVQANHIDLEGSISDTYNTTSGDLRNVSDSDGHGTHTTGIITANNNTLGIVGVAPKAKIISIKVLGDDGAGAYEWISAGINYAVSRNVDIISMSLGGPYDEPGLHAAVRHAYANNIPVICAAGNAGDTHSLDYPGKYQETISIGALDRQNIRASFSQTGNNLDFMAPGVDILSTVPVNSYAVYSGTCLTRSNLVYTRNGPISIADLVPGEEAYSYNINNDQIESKKVLRRWSNGQKRTRKIFTNKTSIECTDNHPILVKSGHSYLKWKSAGSIKKDDYIICGYRQLPNKTTLTQVRTEKVKTITNSGIQEVFDIEIEDNHNFITNNIIVHNSMATPWASGVVALMLSKHLRKGGNTPVNTVDQIKEHIKKTAIDIDQAGKDYKTGFGLIDAQRSIKIFKTADSIPEHIPEKIQTIEERVLDLEKRVRQLGG